MEPRGIRAALAASVAAVSVAASGCGIIGNPLARRAEPSTAASAAASPSPSPTAAPLPEAGQCFNTLFMREVDLGYYPPVDCTGPHRGETVYVGRFVGGFADRPAPPDVRPGDPAELVAAENDTYLDCAREADEYLGHSWIHMLVHLEVSVPTYAAWAAGARWYRCDLYQMDWKQTQTIERTSSLKTAWPGATCLNQNKDGWPVVPCSQKHPGEFVGGFMLPATMTKEPKTDKEFRPLYDKCRKVMATYLAVTTARAQYFGVSVWWQADSSYWPLGRRVAFCFTWTGKSTSSYVTGSARGGKGRGL